MQADAQAQVRHLFPLLHECYTHHTVSFICWLRWLTAKSHRLPDRELSGTRAGLRTIVRSSMNAILGAVRMARLAQTALDGRETQSAHKAFGCSPVSLQSPPTRFGATSSETAVTTTTAASVGQRTPTHRRKANGSRTPRRADLSQARVSPVGAGVGVPVDGSRITPGMRRLLRRSPANTGGGSVNSVGTNGGADSGRRGKAPAAPPSMATPLLHHTS